MERSPSISRGMVLLSLGIATVLLCAICVAAPAPADRAGVEFFETKIRPVLVERCYSCHSAGAKKLKANLRLDSREGILKGGDSGPAVVPGKLDDSNLILALHWEEGGLQMPPKQKLPADQIAAFEAWVKMGAPMPADAPAPARALGMKGPARSAPSEPAKIHAMTLAEARSFWSFIPPKDPPVPPASAANVVWSRSEIDRFLLAKLNEKHLSPAPPADRRTLIRRATYDLLGLPPSAQEIDAFEKDPSPRAYENLIDRLLASPHYGERWGRYWLDVARYADTKGYVFMEERQYPFSYTYRDWVIAALNQDLPYDQFLIQQIAADRLDLKNDKRPLAALGFLTLGRRFLNNQADIIDDRIDVVCRGTMALTVSCARCHDHKYDPIPTADYYSLYGVFASSREPDELPQIGPADPKLAASFKAELAQRQGALDDFERAKHAEYVDKFRSSPQIARYLLAAQKGMAGSTGVPDDFMTVEDEKALNPFMIDRWREFLTRQAQRNDHVFSAWRSYIAGATTQPAKLDPSKANAIIRDEVIARKPASIKEVANLYAEALARTRWRGAEPARDAAPIAELRAVLFAADSPTTVALDQTQHLLSHPDKAKLAELRQAIDSLMTTHPGSPPRAMALEDLPTPVEPHIFKRGNPANPGDVVPRQFLAVLSGKDRKPFTSGSGRLELARAIASRDNPLTARVIVNRVWMYHFGAGLVRTPSDFGTRGDRPTHPELLDWLARRFVEDGWSLKKLHKRIMLSAAYQQSSVNPNPAAKQIDPDNRLLARANLRRLDFEAMRDSILVASAQLDLMMGGRPVDIFAQPFVPRRSIYAFIDRQNLPGTFRTFDFASPDSTSSQRFQTSVPQQALFMMNSPFVIEQARKVAVRGEVAKSPDARGKLNALYRDVLGRSPTQREVNLAVAFIDNEQKQSTESLAARKSPWEYGFGPIDESTGTLRSFTPLPHFTGSVWQGGPVMPDPKTSWASLTATGGHPGDPAHAVVRRFVASEDCTISIAGALAHHQKEGNGVRARIIAPREGAIASWLVHNQNVSTDISTISLKKGDPLDFVVDCHGEVSFDAFEWKITITKQSPDGAVAGQDNATRWDSERDFRGPSTGPTAPLNPWEKLAQVLMESNEFMFVD